MNIEGEYPPPTEEEVYEALGLRIDADGSVHTKEETPPPPPVDTEPVPRPYIRRTARSRRELAYAVAILIGAVLICGFLIEAAISFAIQRREEARWASSLTVLDNWQMLVQLRGLDSVVSGRDVEGCQNFDSCNQNSNYQVYEIRTIKQDFLQKLVVATDENCFLPVYTTTSNKGILILYCKENLEVYIGMRVGEDVFWAWIFPTDVCLTRGRGERMFRKVPWETCES